MIEVTPATIAMTQAMAMIYVPAVLIGLVVLPIAIVLLIEYFSDDQ